MKKVYSAPEVEVVPMNVNATLMMVSDPGPVSDGAHYSMFFWDSVSQDDEGFNIWQ